MLTLMQLILLLVFMVVIPELLTFSYHHITNLMILFTQMS